FTRPALLDRLRQNILIRGAFTSLSGAIGLFLLVLLVGLALFDPLASPDSPTAVAGIPFAKPSWQHVLGLDFLGRDVLSRFLAGGRVLLWVAFTATLLAYAGGILVGMAAGYRRGIFE